MGGEAETAILAVFLGAAAWTDVRSRRIPNSITFPMMAVGLALGLSHGGASGLGASLAGLLLGGALLLPLFLLRGMGAGDVKLLAGVGAFVGPASVFASFLVIAIVGAFLAAGQLLVTGRGQRLKAVFQGWLLTLSLRKDHVVLNKESGDTDGNARNKLPYAVPIAIGTLAVCAFRLFGPPLF